MKLWAIPQDLDDDISMILSAEHKPRFHYRYNIIKLTFRNRHNGQQGKAIQLLSIRDTETEKAEEWLIKNVWSNPIMRITPTGEAIYQKVINERKR